MKEKAATLTLHWLSHQGTRYFKKTDHATRIKRALSRAFKDHFDGPVSTLHVGPFDHETMEAVVELGSDPEKNLNWFAANAVVDATEALMGKSYTLDAVLPAHSQGTTDTSVVELVNVEWDPEYYGQRRLFDSCRRTAARITEREVRDYEKDLENTRQEAEERAEELEHVTNGLIDLVQRMMDGEVELGDARDVKQKASKLSDVAQKYENAAVDAERLEGVVESVHEEYEEYHGEALNRRTSRCTIQGFDERF